MVHAATPAPPDAPKDAPSPQHYVFQIDVFQVSIPMGTFSGNEAFWKRIDEQCVDPVTHEMLFNNGIRVGQAPISELDFFKKFMDEKPSTSRMTTTGAEAQRVELEMKTDLPEQTIFVFDANSQHAGKSYDACSNVINMSFQATPRKPGQLRLTLCPMVRTKRKHFQYTAMHNEMEVEYVSAEMLYDLNLCVDIPKDTFFIVMPSTEARLGTSVGHAFLMKDGPTQRLEQILLIIPHVIQAEPAK
jgi:hypothetical protein